ncbi:MAG: J domain-containing protein [Burkholderiaceae bacterium]
MSASSDSPMPEDSFTQAWFSNAFETLASRLTQAQCQVISCVDAACPPAWFKLMLACRRRGLEVTLIVPAIELNLNSGLAWERLTAMGGQLIWLETDRARILTSACVIDQSIVISGSFGDLRSVAATNFSGIVIQHRPQTVDACWQGLNELLQTRTGAVHQPLAVPGDPSPLSHQLILRSNPATQLAPWQLDLLAEHVMALDAEIADMHRKINAFDRQQDHDIGDILRKFLDLKQRYLTQRYHQLGGEQEQAQAQAAQTDYEQFQNRESSQAQLFCVEPLQPQQQEEIKSLYRKLAMLCHPDRVQEHNKQQSQDLFQRLQSSYRNSDFSALKKLEQQLQKLKASGHSTTTGSTEGLAQRLNDLQERLARQYLARQLILQNPTWRTLNTQSNWGLWFSQQASYLQAEMQRYSQALEVAVQPPP